MTRPSKYFSRASALMLATCAGANAGASSMTTRPVASSRYSVFSGSSGRQSAGVERSSTSADVGGLAAGAAGAAGGCCAQPCRRARREQAANFFMGLARCGGRPEYGKSAFSLDAPPESELGVFTCRTLLERCVEGEVTHFAAVHVVDAQRRDGGDVAPLGRRRQHLERAAEGPGGERLAALGAQLELELAEVANRQVVGDPIGAALGG